MKLVNIKYTGWDCPLNIAMQIVDVVKNKDMETIDKNIKLISIVSDLSEDEIENLPIAEYNRLLSQCEWMNREPIGEYNDHFILNGREYVVDNDLKRLTTAQYIDFQTFQKDIKKNIKYILAVFILPKGKKYNEGYDIDEVANDIWEYMPYIYVEGLLSFFLLAFQSLINSLLTYSILKMKKAMKREKMGAKRIAIARQIINLKALRKDLEKNGVGLH